MKYSRARAHGQKIRAKRRALARVKSRLASMVETKVMATIQ